MDLTISIVNWNVRDYLEKCLESVFQYSEGISLEVIVVDNASTDKSVEMLKNKFPSVHLIENTENIGYGCAHNQAIRIAKGRHILFLNPDTEMLSDTLPRMLKFMDTHPEAGVCQCREVKGRNDISEIIVLKRLEGLKLSLLKSVNSIFPNSLTERSYVNLIAKTLELSRRNFGSYKELTLEGGFLLIRKTALEESGVFNPIIFYGGEGAELTTRIRKLGWKLYRVMGVKIIHYCKKSFDQIGESRLDELEERWKESLTLQNILKEMNRLNAR